MYKHQIEIFDGYQLAAGAEWDGDRVKTGYLVKGTRRVPIKNFIPRFVDSSNYADSFGFQWNLFKLTQFDSQTGLSLSKNRFYTNTKWKESDLKGKRILEVGCGAGRFTEILKKTSAYVTSVDYSSAVESCYRNNAPDENLLLIQGNIFELPFQPSYFDYVFCYGVLQHTPDPMKAFASLVPFLKRQGRISIDHYVNRLFSPWCTPKYLWRPIAKRMKPETLLALIRFYIPLYLPIDTFIRRIPKIGNRILSMIPIPCWNYLEFGLSDQQRKEWAILDTFDALSPAFDIPKDISDYEKACASLPLEKVEMFYGSNGLVVNASKYS